ncbi:STAS domain-containing protein [Nonomuraea pusilla]|uniref:STAS domain-containing protein n=1 Tax=Nonomuraea pusilla TaxID=46177 RepID=UPI0033206385
MNGDQERLLYQDKQLKIVMRFAPQAPAVALVGEVDATNSAALARTLAGLRESGCRLDVDTGELTFVDLSGMRVLALPALPAAERWIRLLNVTPFQQRMLRMMGWFYEPHPADRP